MILALKLAFSVEVDEERDQASPLIKHFFQMFLTKLTTIYLTDIFIKMGRLGPMLFLICLFKKRVPWHHTYLTRETICA